MTMKLLETLTHFNGGSSVSELCEKFSEIASVFLYGGYIDVNNIIATLGSVKRISRP